MTAISDPSNETGFFYVTGGTLSASAPSYVERRADAELLTALQHGEFCYVLNARQMGKSSLMTRTAARLHGQGHAVAILDLTEFGKELSQEQWYYGMLRKIGREIGLFDPMVAFWKQNHDLSPLQRLMETLREIALPALANGEISSKGGPAQREAGEKTEHKSRRTETEEHEIRISNFENSASLVLFVDEIDFVRSLPFSADEFFAAIRECYTRRANDPQYKRLTFCLLGVATPADLIQEAKTTPFNIGTRIELTDFTPEEAAPLAAGLIPYQDARTPSNQESGFPSLHHLTTSSIEQSRRLLNRILYWTGGHPYLTQRLCRALAQQTEPTDDSTMPRPHNALTPNDVDRLCAELFFSHRARATDDNLAVVAQRVLAGGADIVELLTLYAKVRNNSRGISYQEADPISGVLRLSGIVRASEGRLQVRNRIYDHVFDKQWILENMPDAELQRQRRAYRRGLLRAAAVSAVLLLVMGALTTWAATNAHKAEKASEKSRISEGNALIKAKEAQSAEQKAKDEKDRALKAVAKEQQATADKGKALQKVEQEKNKALLAKQAETQAKNQATVALSNEKKATAFLQAARDRDERLLYPSNISRAQKALEQGNLVEAQALLNEIHRTQHQRESNGFEWHYLNELCKQGAVQNLKKHRNLIRSVVCSTDGKLLVSSDFDGKVYLWNVEQGGQVRRRTDFEGNAFQEINSLVLVKDKQTLITGGSNGICFFNLATGSNLHNPITQETLANGEQKYVNALALSPDETMLAIGLRGRSGTTGVVEFWDLKHYKKLEAVEQRDLKGNALNVHALAFSPDGKLLASGGSQGNHDKKDLLLTKVWDVATRKEVAILTETPLNPINPWVNSIAFSPDSHFLATGNGDHTVRIWDTQRILKGTPDALSEGHRVFTKCDMLPLNVNTEEIWSLAFSHNGRLLAAGDKANVIKLWDVSRLLFAEPDKGGHEPLELATLRGHEKEVDTLTFSPDDTHLISGGGDAVLKVWDLSRSVLPVLYAHRDQASGGIYSLVYSSDGRFMVSSSVKWQTQQCEVRVWDTRTLKEIDCHLPSFPVLTRLAFAPDNRTLALSTAALDPKQRHLLLWDVIGRKEIGEFKEPQDPITALAFSPKGHLLATVQGTNQSKPNQYRVRLWDTKRLKELTEQDNPALKGFGTYFWDMYSLAFSPDGKMLVAGGGGGDMWWWDMDTYRRMPFSNLMNNHAKDADKQLKSLLYRPPSEREHQGSIRAIAFSTDGKWMATGGEDKIVHLWDVKTRQVRFTLRESNTSITALAFSPDSKTLVTSYYDGTVKLWPLFSAQENLVQDAVTFHESLGWVVALTFSPDGKSLATGHASGVIQLRQTGKDSSPSSAREAPVRTSKPIMIRAVTVHLKGQ